MEHSLTLPEILVLLSRIIVTIVIILHVLRTKFDTSAAVGWIGFCCFMPFTGAILYAMFGINRVRRLAKRLTDGHRGKGRDRLSSKSYRVTGQFSPLAQMVGTLTDRSLLGRNKIECLHNGEEIYPRLISAINEARRSILLCSYIFRADQIGKEFVAALERAHRRGVAVRVLVDGIGSGYFFSGVTRALRRAQIPHAQFMHSFFPWRMPFVNLRNHRKILVVDGAIGFMGGINIGDENLLPSTSPRRVADTHFALHGPIVHQLAEACAWDWAFTTGEELDGAVFFPEVQAAGAVPLRVVTAGPDNDLEKIEFTILQALTLAKSHVRIMTPYFLPGERLSTEICLAALRGVKVDIIIPKRGNHRIIDYARDASLEQFLMAGCDVWLARPPFNHAKLMVVDTTWAFVGSSNMDLRSLRLNFEINLEIYDDAFAQQLAAFMDDHKANRLTHRYLERIPRLKKLRNAGVRLLTPYL